MKSTLLLIALALAPGGCRGIRPAPAPADAVRSRADSADVLEAVWRAPANGYTGQGVRWLYLPSADSVGVTASDAVRATLSSRGVLASARRPAGHDTVVYQVRRWTRDSTGRPVLELSSEWTWTTAGAPGMCMSAGNAETFRVRRGPAGWEAERFGQGIHGVGYCRSNGRRP
jgi:hypothetical protein